jgi:hypothetical protein
VSSLANKEDFLTLVSLKNGTKEVEQKEWKSKIIDFTFFFKFASLLFFGLAYAYTMCTYQYKNL